MTWTTSKLQQFAKKAFVVMSDAGLLEEREVGMGWLIFDQASKSLVGLGSVWGSHLEEPENEEVSKTMDVTPFEMNATEWASYHVKLIRRQQLLGVGEDPPQSVRTSVRKLAFEPMSESWVQSDLQKSRKVPRHHE